MSNHNDTNDQTNSSSESHNGHASREGNREGSLLEAALDYVSRGWPVIPIWGIVNGKCACPKGHRDECRTPGKHPLLRNWQSDALTSRDAAIMAFEDWPEANVGIRTGPVAEGTYLWVLDIDNGPEGTKGGSESLAALERKHGELPETRCVISGHGMHYYWYSRVPVKTTSGTLGQGIDTRGGGGEHGHGLVIAPPSMHVTGRRYAHDLGTPEEPAEAPQWLVDLVNAEIAVTLSAPGEVASHDGIILDGALGGPGRKKSLIRLGRSMRANGADEEAIYAALVRHNATKCSPPLEDSEVRRMTQQCMKKAAGKSKRYREFEREQAIRAGDWKALLPRDSKGQIKPTFAAHCVILRNDPEYAGRLRYDSMALQILLDGQALTDHAVAALREQIEQRHDLSTNEAAMRDAISLVASERSFHPVQQYLDSVQWDGVNRIDTFAHDILGLNPDPLTVKQLRCWFISAVARARQPGCKVDNVLIFVGPQGSGKSTLFAELGGAWFSDTHMDIGNKDAYMQLAGTWIYEWGEVEKIVGRRGADEVKAFLTSRSDKFRPPYGRSVVKQLRSCVIVGSTNEDGFLTDPTGSRRFWILSAKDAAFIDLPRLRAIRDQLWAEADVLYRTGEQWWLSREEEVEREKVSLDYLEHDAWERIVSQYLAKNGASEGTGIHIVDILRDALCLPNYQINSAASRRVGTILRKLGYVKHVIKDSARRSVKVWRYAHEEHSVPVYDNPDAPPPTTEPHDDFDF